MKKPNSILMATALAGLSLLGGSLVEDTTAHAQGSATVGSLRGVIRDKGNNNEAAAGATVVATSPAMQGEQVVITDDSGQYFITALPPGVYSLTVYYNDGTFSRSNVLIQIGKEAVVNVTVDSKAGEGKPKGETIVITGTAPIVDQGSTKTGITITDEYTRNIPTARTFGGVVGSTAGAQVDTYGISFAGATSAENTYLVEGINTTDTGFGGLSSNLPNEFISETEVITGGYNAEFGRATGGIVNVVTKQGGNEFHGSVYGYFRPGAFISDAQVIQREGGSIDSKNDLDYNYDVGFEVGGPIIKDKLWFHVGFNPSFEKRTLTRLVQKQIDEDQDGVPDVDPETGFTIHQHVTDREIPLDFKTYFFTAKINGAIDQNNQFQISAFGSPRNATDYYTITRNPDQTLWKYQDGAYDVAGKWTSKFNDSKTQVDAVLGFHRGFETQDPYNAAENVPTVFYNYERSLYDFRDLEGDSLIEDCNDMSGSDPYPLIRNCPVTAYTTQGLAYLETRTNDRTTGSFAVTQRVKAAGYHVFKAGADVELATYDANKRYTGGSRFRRSANTATGAPGRWQLREYYKFVRNLTDAEAADLDSVMLEPGQTFCANDRAICGKADNLQADTNNTSFSAFIQDQWQIKPNFTINAGVRWEQQTGHVAEFLQGQFTPDGELIPNDAYKLSNLIAPRLGFIYDPTKEGRSKLMGHWGRFYENVPMDLNVRAFGGEITNFQNLNQNRFTPTNGKYDPNCDQDHIPGTPDSTIVSNLSMCTDSVQVALLGEGIEYVSPGLKGQYTEELVLGSEYEIVPNATVGANFIHRTMPIVIEDISVDGGNTYLITNPGENYDSEAASLKAQADQLMASSDPQQQALGALYANRADQLLAVKRFEKPVRNYDALQLLARSRPTKQSLLQASYTYSVSKGNYPGLFSTETGQLDPNLTSLYDLPDLMANRYGPMGLDRPHNLKIDGFYVFDLNKIALTTGVSLRAQSGLAHNILGASPHPGYGTGESYLLARGSGQRGPVTSQLDIRLAVGYNLNKNSRLEGFVNIFNLLNSQDEANQDENYTLDAVNPIVGGDASDLLHVKTLDFATGNELNSTPVVNKNFRHLNARQAARNVQLGVRLTF